VALINTYIAHRVAAHRLALVSHLAPGDPATEAKLQGITAALGARGGSLFEAPQRALAVMESLVARQATLLSYLDAFLLVALFAFCCVPLAMLAGRPKPTSSTAGRAAVEAH
jgi:DHA2 family multidrug resistance protein